MSFCVGFLSYSLGFTDPTLREVIYKAELSETCIFADLYDC